MHGTLPYDWQLIKNVTTYLQLEGLFSKLCVCQMKMFSLHTQPPALVLTAVMRGGGFDQTNKPLTLKTDT